MHFGDDWTPESSAENMTIDAWGIVKLDHFPTHFCRVTCPNIFEVSTLKSWICDILNDGERR